MLLCYCTVLVFTSLLNKLKLYFSNRQGTPEKQRIGTGGPKDP